MPPKWLQLLKKFSSFGKSYETPVVKSIVEAPKVKYYGPTMGKSYAAKINPNLIDLDTYGLPEYTVLAKKYGYKDWREMILSDKGDYNAEYKQLIKDQINRLKNDPSNTGKTIMVSNASLLNPNSGIKFDNVPVIPERSIMAARNHARHPWETIEHGEQWWDNLVNKGTPLKTDNRFVSQIEYIPPQTKYISLEPKSSFTSLDPEWEGLESPYLTVYHRGLDGQQPYEHPKFKGVLGGAGYDRSWDKWFNIKPEFKMTPNEARHFNLQKLADKSFGGDTQTALEYLNKKRK